MKTRPKTRFRSLNRVEERGVRCFANRQRDKGQVQGRCRSWRSNQGHLGAIEKWVNPRRRRRESERTFFKLFNPAPPQIAVLNSKTSVRKEKGSRKKGV
uniref:Uncharacterized protein n=1 Tax=Salix viminalis TaxID=40686 RepID=A0A6N2N0C1_SALVM